MILFDLVIFDFDGTVLKTDDAITYCTLKTLRERNNHLPVGTEARIRELIGTGTTLGDTFERLGMATNDEVGQAVQRYREIYAQEGLSLCSLYDGVKEAVRHFSNAGVKVAILSNKGHEALRKAVEHFGLQQDLSFFAGERAGIKAKPDPGVYNSEMVPLLGLTEKARVLMVGDTEADIQFARAINASSCWVTYGFGDRAACEALGPTFTVDKMSDAISLVMERERAVDKPILL
jgi:phosphoglycolate phosphatase